jgi:hypothetical protein
LAIFLAHLPILSGQAEAPLGLSFAFFSLFFRSLVFVSDARIEGTVAPSSVS